MMPDVAAIAADVERGRTIASELTQLRLLGDDARKVHAMVTLARSRWQAVRKHEYDLYDWLDETFVQTPPTDDDWITALGIYEQVVDVRRLLEDAGKDAA